MHVGRVIGAIAVGVAALSPSGAARAGDDSRAVVRVGETALTVADVERRLRSMPAFQLERYGATTEEIRRRFVQEVLVPELVLAEEARQKNVENNPAVWDRVRETLRQAIDNRLRDELAAKEPATDAEVKSYFEQNRDRFETPRRIRLWQIVIADRELGSRIIAEAKGSNGLERWRQLARDHSLDKATSLRGGDLGFVRPDGTTDAPRVRADAKLFEAADKVKDGEIIGEPIALDGGKWAIVWRRGSLPAVHRALEQEARSIRQILLRKKLEERRSELLDRLHKERVRLVDDQLLQYLAVDTFGDVQARQKPGIVPRRPRGPPAPGQTERGLR
jgi:peptidyl-prolyl cis-trans isomerase C